MNTAPWQTIPARIVPGFQLASGTNRDPLFPGGTLRMQTPYFRELGLDLGCFHPGTVNAQIAPRHFQVGRAPHTFRQVKWHPTDPPEDFSFFDCRLVRDDAPPVAGLIYYPHPETKPKHFGDPDVLEMILPWIDGLSYGDAIRLEVPADQIIIE